MAEDDAATKGEEHGSRDSLESFPPTFPPDVPRPGWADVRLWHIRAVRDLFWIAVTVAIVALAYALRAATIPALVALTLAYLVDPLVSGVKDRFGVPRVVTTLVAVLVLLALVVVVALFVLPAVLTQLSELGDTLPRYVDRVAHEAGLSRDTVRGLREAPTDLLPQPQDLVDGAVGLFGAVASAVGLGAYLVLAGIFSFALFLYWTVYFDRLPNLRRYLPASQREDLWELLQEFEAAFGGFLRGQVLVAMFTTLGFALGFWLIGVPFGLVAALVGGAMSFIPNGQAAGPALAVLFGFLAGLTAGEVDWVRVALLPGLVYACTQSLETFVVTPLVQGSMTKLHPLVVFGALIAGGAVGGLIGVFLAIPIAACMRIVAVEILIPRLRRFTATN